MVDVILEDGSQKTIKLDARNFHQMICKYIFKLVKYGRDPYGGKIYFEKIFQGMDAQEIWDKYYNKSS